MAATAVSSKLLAAVALAVAVAGFELVTATIKFVRLRLANSEQNLPQFGSESQSVESWCLCSDSGKLSWSQVLRHLVV
ncbi:hypothetical protein F0562_011528 [Nyssa sinensis]|uniref:Uncharacterized protein n=1 Tax=Nyssa sinensis TaxID=561372 RepID=A0A5J4ZQ80_9ASTE|nr:hypothetical protein F0562_011528 [Nyssa sinensis]